MNLKEEFKKQIINSLCICEDDLTDTEKEIISTAYFLWKEKLDDYNDLQKDYNKLNIENINLKQFKDDVIESSKTKHND